MIMYVHILFVVMCAEKRAVTQKRSDNKRLDKTVDKIRNRLPLMKQRVDSLSDKLTEKQSKQHDLDNRLAKRRGDLVKQVEEFVFPLQPVPDR